MNTNYDINRRKNACGAYRRKTGVSSIVLTERHRRTKKRTTRNREENDETQTTTTTTTTTDEEPRIYSLDLNNNGLKDKMNNILRKLFVT
jgi:hypothetical protein